MCQIRYEYNKIDKNISYDKDIICQTHKLVREQFPKLFEELRTKGWHVSLGVTHVEDSKAIRLRIKNRSIGI